MIGILLWRIASSEMEVVLNPHAGFAPHDIHIVVSTGCSPGQNWQAETMMHSWKRINHPGKLTRIVAGCENEKQKEEASKTAISEATIHFTPDYCFMDEIVMGIWFVR